MDKALIRGSAEEQVALLGCQSNCNQLQAPSQFACNHDGPDHCRFLGVERRDEPLNTMLRMAAPAALLFVAAPAYSVGIQDFDLVNAIGYTISEVYVAPSSGDEWEEDVMGRDILENGETVRIEFTPRQKICRYDIKVVWDDGDEAV